MTVEVEVLSQPMPDRIPVYTFQARNDPVRREHDQPRIVHRHQIDHDVIGPLRPTRLLPAVPQRRFVPVVPVHDKHLGPRQRVCQSLDQCRILGEPHPVPHRAISRDLLGGDVLTHRGCGLHALERLLRVHHIDRGSDLHRLVQPGAGVGFTGIIDPEDRAELRPGGRKQAEAILLRFRQRFLVRQHDPLAVFVQAEQRQDTRPRPLLARGQAEALRVGIERRRRFPHEDAGGEPIPVEVGRRLVPVAPTLRLWQFEPDDIVRAGIREPLSHLRRDHVIRRRDHRTQVADLLRIVSHPAERLDLCHLTLPHSGCAGPAACPG